MKARPILFSAPMVRALLAGTKTQTRRVVTPPRGWPQYSHADPFAMPPAVWWWNGEHTHVGVKQECPYGQPGDRLWVRETWQHSNHPFGPLDKTCAIFYRADYSADPHGMDGEKSPEGKYRQWRPSIHMPRWASRILLEITGIRVERLQDISEADCRAEGLGDTVDRAHHWYRVLWEQINGPGSWEANPWVWVVEFKRIRP